MKLEANKSYVDREGTEHGPLKFDERTGCFYVGNVFGENQKIWFSTGVYSLWSQHTFDLIAEAPQTYWANEYEWGVASSFRSKEQADIYALPMRKALLELKVVNRHEVKG